MALMGRDGATAETMLHEKEIEGTESRKPTVGVLRSGGIADARDPKQSQRENNLGRLSHTVLIRQAGRRRTKVRLQRTSLKSKEL